MSRPIWPLPGKARQLAIYTTRCVKMPVFIALQADGKVGCDKDNGLRAGLTEFLASIKSTNRGLSPI